MLLAYIYRSITHRVHFLDNGRSHLWRLAHLRQRFAYRCHGRHRPPRRGLVSGLERGNSKRNVGDLIAGG
jgi:hypothetical protein